MALKPLQYFVQTSYSVLYQTQHSSPSVSLHGAATWRACPVSHCMVLPPGELVPCLIAWCCNQASLPRVSLHGAATWRACPASHCMVLPPGELAPCLIAWCCNQASLLHVSLHGAATLRAHPMSHCMVLPPGEFHSTSCYSCTGNQHDNSDTADQRQIPC